MRDVHKILTITINIILTLTITIALNKTLTKTRSINKFKTETLAKSTTVDMIVNVSRAISFYKCN